jgi:hydroxymethylbilane synthase
MVIGTRGSALALCQAKIVQAKLEALHPARAFRLQPIQARADQHPELPLTAMGGEGVFVKELQAALAAGRIDCAVHSMKDLPLAVAVGLRLAAVLEREEPRDALVSRRGESFARLAAGSRIGTSSLRRQSQLLCERRDLVMAEIRGNVDTRLRKLDAGEYDAIVVAACGLIRLGLASRITERLGFSIMLPEPGQGALAVEARSDDAEALDLLERLEDRETRACVEAERALLRALGGGCRLPIAAYASCQDGALALEGAVISADGGRRLHGKLAGPMREPVALGERLARQLSAQGAGEVLSQI